MARMRYVVTDGTGFIGRRVVPRILSRRTLGDEQNEVWVLVRRESLARFERLAGEWGDRARPLVGDLTAADLGITDEALAEIGDIDHVVHCAAIYDITVDEDAQRAANVDGTRAVIDLAVRLDATLHHISSIAVAGSFPGVYTEEDFDSDTPTRRPREASRRRPVLPPMTRPVTPSDLRAALSRRCGCYARSNTRSAWCRVCTGKWPALSLAA